RARLGAGPHRRHARLHRRPAVVDQSDRPEIGRPAGGRGDRPALPGRDLPGRSVRGAAADGPDGDAAGGAAVRGSEPGGARPHRAGRVPPRRRGAWTQVRAAARLARLGCDAYAYAMVAAGRIDLVAESQLKIWDWSALAPVIEAAGGEVVDWRGGAPKGDGQILAVGDARLKDQ